MSKYTSNNELNNFDFNESFISEIRLMNSAFIIYADNVKILSENSHNHDVRTMRANELEFCITNAKILSFIEEGYKIYDADGNLSTTVNDRTILFEEYTKEFELLSGCTIYEITQTEDIYEISINTEDHTYSIKVSGNSNIIKWDRFLNL